MTASLADLPGVPESRLPAALLAQLPGSTPAPPWPCRVRAVVWVQRSRCPVPGPTGRAWPLVLAAVVQYLDSPVGAYREVFAGPLVRGLHRPVLHVPFIAVDSLPSVHGGRAHWSLPKALASFAGAWPATTVTGDGWSVRVDATTSGPRLPVAGPLPTSQDGRVAVARLSGRGRLARVHVEAQGPTLSGWLGTGTHLGVVADGEMVVQSAR